MPVTPVNPVTQDDETPTARLDQRLQSHIGSKLKQYYDEIVSEPIPDKFKALLEQLESGVDAAPPASERNR